MTTTRLKRMNELINERLKSSNMSLRQLSKISAIDIKTIKRYTGERSVKRGISPKTYKKLLESIFSALELKIIEEYNSLDENTVIDYILKNDLESKVRVIGKSNRVSPLLLVGEDKIRLYNTKSQDFKLKLENKKGLKQLTKVSNKKE